jgi:flagellar protein FlbD
MIPLHRLTNPYSPLYINPDLIQMVDETPDTVVTLTSGSKLIVAETAGEVLELVCAWHAKIVARAFDAPEPRPPLASVAAVHQLLRS